MNKLSWDSFKSQFHKSWWNQMQGIIESPEVWEIYQQLKEDGGKFKITPESKNVFNAFQVDLNKLNIVILGMSPYPQVILNTRKAIGVAFSCEQYGGISPSLTKLYDAIEDDVYDGLALDRDKKERSLQYLVRQGILLGNAALTCIKDRPESHIELWRPFWRLVFDKIFSTKSGLIFIFMGKNSQELEQYVDPSIHHILECEHPVASSYQNRAMRHERVFSRASKILRDSNNIEIDWLDSFLPF